MQNETRIEISKTDLKNVCFTSPSAMIMGDKLLTYAARRELRGELSNIHAELLNQAGDSFMYVTKASVTVPTSEDVARGKNIKEAFSEALNDFRMDGKPLSLGEEILVLPNDAPVMTEDICNLQVALSCANDDSASKDDQLLRLQMDMADWWVVAFAGKQTACELLGSFYDAVMTDD